MQVMDSLAAFMPLSSMTIQEIAKIYSIPSDHSVLKLKTLPVQQQDGYLDCSLFAVAYSIEVCCKNISGFGGMTFDQKRMRAHLRDCLLQKEMFPFPKTNSESGLPHPKEKMRSVKVYCICKMPADFDSLMIECEKCQQWFHCSCINIDQDDIPKDWECPSCKQK